MIWLPLILSCKLGSNTPPRFQKFNGTKVKYIFGIAYLPEQEAANLITKQGERVDFDIEVRDADGDEIELLFPSAPAGLHFSANEKTGYWQVPTEPISESAPFQVVAVDERGASDVLFFNYYIEDFVYDTGDWLNYFTTKLHGEANIEQGWDGTVHFYTDLLPCTWTWEETTGTVDDSCQLCTKAWTVQLNQGEQSEGTCEEFSEILNEITEIRVGWAPEVVIDGVTYPNPVFYYVDGEGWMPNGRGSVQNNRLSFDIDL
jgi:hypothetical protein